MPRKEPKGGFMHGSSGYDNYGCRCDVCRAGNAAKQKRIRESNREERELVDGVWVHPLATHGTLTGYQYYKCRCRDCTRASREA
jgi:hypothetical protein